MRTYTTREGDTASWIAWKHYGAASGQATVQLLDANPGLAGHGPILPAGLVLNLPEIAAPAVAATVQGVSLWD